MTMGIYCMICGCMWTVRFRDGQMIHEDCPNKDHHGLKGSAIE